MRRAVRVITLGTAIYIGNIVYVKYGIFYGNQTEELTMNPNSTLDTACALGAAFALFTKRRQCSFLYNPQARSTVTAPTLLSATLIHTPLLTHTHIQHQHISEN